MAMKTDKAIRCSSPAVSYGRVLFEQNIPEAVVRRTAEMFDTVPQIRELFLNPVIALQKKMDVIDRIFPEEMHNFLKTVCRHQRMNILDEIFTAYSRCMDENNSVIRAVLVCTDAPDEKQMKGMENFLCRKYGAGRAVIEVRQDETLLGGFILRAGSDEYDWSMKGRLERLTQTLGGR